jgi:hypothetical protein
VKVEPEICPVNMENTNTVVGMCREEVGLPGMIVAFRLAASQQACSVEVAGLERIWMPPYVKLAMASDTEITYYDVHYDINGF